MFTQPPKRARSWRPWLLGLLAAALTSGGLLFAVGDFGLGQRILDGVERRALAERSTRADRWGLRLFYSTLQLGGRVVYPQAAKLLAHYCAGQGDTLRFDARPLLRHPEVQQALRWRKPGITFRHQAKAGPFYVARRTDWSLYYTFDLLHIRWVPGGVVFQDNYFFQPLARRSYTRFRFGQFHCRLNDGLVRVAYPQARSFVVRSEVMRPLARAASVN